MFWWLAGAVAWGAPDGDGWQWASLPLPAGIDSVQHVAESGGDLILQSGGHAVYRRTDGGPWRQLAGPLDATAGLPDTSIVVGADGATILQVRRGPAATRTLGPQGWGDWEPILDWNAVGSVALDRSGVGWAVVYDGRLARRTGGTWQALGRVTNGYAVHVTPDEAGGAWVLVSERCRLAHWRPDRPVRTVAPPGGTDCGRPAMGPDGHLLAALDGSVRRLEDDGSWDRLLTLDRAGLNVAGWARGWFAFGGRIVYRHDGSALTEIPAPGRCTWMPAWSGNVFASCGDRLLRLESGPGPLLRDVSDDWDLQDLGAASPHVVDLDDDGLDDLLLFRDDRLHVVHQRLGAFVAGPSVEAGRSTVLACDLDRDGRRDLLLASRDASPRLRYLRNHGDWLEPVEARLGMDDPFGHPVHGGLSCADIDGDGDLDVATTVGNHRTLVHDPVALFANDGAGWLQRVPTSRRGIAVENWPGVVRFEDFDKDGVLDVLAEGRWGESGHALLRGTASGTLVDVSGLSGLVGRYASPNHSWIADVDRDGWHDVVMLDDQSGVVLFRGEGDMRFTDRTSAAGLGAWLRDPRLHGDLGDVNGDGWLDLVACHASGCRLAMGGPGGFEDRSSLVSASRDVVRVWTLDLGGDGDRDLLLHRKGGLQLLEVVGSPADRTAAARLELPRPSDDPLSWIRRRSSWIRGLDLLHATLWGGPLILGVVLGRSRDWTVIGRAPLALALCGVTLLGWAAVLEKPPMVRWAAALAAVSGGTAFVWAEGRVATWRSARRIAGYVLEGVLGRGGMGTVYRAREPGTGRRVALKLVHPELFETDADRTLFHREAEIGASLDDPRLVRIFAWGEWFVVDGGRRRPTAWLAMEIVEGATLRDLLRGRGRFPVDEACAVVRDLALALEVLHGAGIVHRDVKPANVMVLRDGSVKLMDLGAARTVGQLTRSTRQVLGTVGYLPPEQGQGGVPDPRSDIYACGVVLYELLAGRRPFEGRDLVTLLTQVLEGAPPPLSQAREDVDPALEAVVGRALHRDAARRHSTAGALAADLAPWAGDTRSAPVRVAPRAPVAVSVASVQAARSRLGMLVALTRHYLRWARGKRGTSLSAFAISLLEEADDVDPEQVASRLSRARGQRRSGRPADDTWHSDWQDEHEETG